MFIIRRYETEILFTAAFALYQQNRVFATGVVWPTMPQNFTFWPFTEPVG